jgi:hypothetical protein
VTATYYCFITSLGTCKLRARCIATVHARTQRKHFHRIVAWCMCWNVFIGPLPNNAFSKSITLYKLFICINLFFPCLYSVICWVVISWNHVDAYQCLSRTYYLHHHSQVSRMTMKPSCRAWHKGMIYKEHREGKRRKTQWGSVETEEWNCDKRPFRSNDQPTLWLNIFVTLST